MCRTSLGRAVVPDVKYSSERESAGVGPSGSNPVRRPQRIGEIEPTRRSDVADADPDHVARDLREAVVQGHRGEGEPRLGLRDPIVEVGGGEQRRGRNRHRPHLEQAQQDVPDLDGVVQHHDGSIAPLDADGGEPARDPVRAFGEFRVRPTVGAEVRIDDRDGRPVGMLPGHDIEPLQGEVELREFWPAEALDGTVVVVGVLEQEVARVADSCSRCGGGPAGVGHGRSRK